MLLWRTEQNGLSFETLQLLFNSRISPRSLSWRQLLPTFSFPFTASCSADVLCILSSPDPPANRDMSFTFCQSAVNPHLFASAHHPAQSPFRPFVISLSVAASPSQFLSICCLSDPAFVLYRVSSLGTVCPRWLPFHRWLHQTHSTSWVYVLWIRTAEL